MPPAVAIPHGTLSGHKHHRCTCLPCGAAGAADQRRRRLLAAQGQPTTTLIDARATKEHLARLIAQGMSRNRIGLLAGIPITTVDSVPTRKRIRPETAHAILAVETPIPTFVDAAPTWRLIHGMVARGWPRALIAAMLGQGNGVRPCIGRERVRVETARRVKMLADECAIRPGPSRRAAEEAVRHGYNVADLWEDLGNGNDTRSKL